ncbi:putative AGP2beta-2 [Trypanosoma rangeli]|uniref:Putative AGP2beta-2 n=1 Tax=Trypanosoma rangeli TaxID=5698 RepID=A0A422NAB3_TRYRA|nr:putative AGP2beta-2 [Trypanosoma rangeli]RNF02366.1 putative AGP2beta-2 [Trypanosoma rangeli]|eukprot:RNF02366.1 putative AGP2beta-2 [Trypanosoma rangeli]
MQRKVTRDVRIVFFLSIDMVAGCAAGRTYVLHVKRGDKIHTSSPPLTADEGGKLHVNLFRTFTSTLQRQNDQKYKKKELKFRVEEVRSKTVKTFSYDLSKNIVDESFPERKVVIRESNGTVELYLRLRGTAECLHYQQQSVQTGPTVSFTSYMRGTSSASSLVPWEIPSVYDATPTSSIAVDDYVSVIDSLTEAASEKRGDELHSETQETEAGDETNTGSLDKDLARPKSVFQTLMTSPKRSTVDTLNEIRNKNSQGPGFTRGPAVVDSTRKETPPPPKVPSKRIMVDLKEDPVHRVIKQICAALRQSKDTDKESQKVRHAPKEAQLTLNFYVQQTGETLERFVIGFLAHVLLEVCEETRHIGSWLNLLTHVIYGSLLHASHPCNVSDVERMTLRISELRGLDVNTFMTRAKTIVRQLAGGSNASTGIELFWLAGLDYCAKTLALLSVHHVQRFIDNFSTLSPSFEGGRIFMEDDLISATEILCSHFHLLLCNLLSQTNEYVVSDIRAAPPLYRIILAEIMSKLFSDLITVIVEYMCKLEHLNTNGTFHVALKILKLIISWAKGHFLLSVVSPVLVSLVVYCDSVLFPQELLRNRDYRLYVDGFLPLFAANNSVASHRSPWSFSPALSSTMSGSVAVSVLAVLTEFTAGGCRKTPEAERSLWMLVEILDGDKDAAEQVLSAEELFPATAFNGTRYSLSDPGLILPLLAHTVKASSM